MSSFRKTHWKKYLRVPEVQLLFFRKYFINSAEKLISIKENPSTSAKTLYNLKTDFYYKIKTILDY